MVQTSDQWILERTGISRAAYRRSRTSPLRIWRLDAAKMRARSSAGSTPPELDCILVCTVTPDMMFPSTACLVQNKIGAKGAWGFDLIAACSGFLYGLTTGAHLVAARHAQEGAGDRRRHHEPHHRLHRPQPPASCSATAPAPCCSSPPMDERGRRLHRLPGRDRRLRRRLPEDARRRQPHARHRTRPSSSACTTSTRTAQQVFRTPCARCTRSAAKCCARNGLTADDVTLMIPHQANRRIIAATAERLGLPFERVMINIDRYGNTTAGTIPLATRDAIDQRPAEEGRPGAIRGRRRRLHRRRQPLALGVLIFENGPGTGSAPGGPSESSVFTMRIWLRNIFRHLACLAIVFAIVWVYVKLIPVNATTAALTFLLAVLLIATVWGLAAAVTTSLGAVLAFNFFFLPPVTTFTVEDPQNWVALLAFLITAITASQLTPGRSGERSRRSGGGAKPNSCTRSAAPSCWTTASTASCPTPSPTSPASSRWNKWPSTMRRAGRLPAWRRAE